MGIDEAVIKEIVRRILDMGRPERIILFGSAAKAEMGRDSDIDLLVIEQCPSNVRQESIRLRQALRGLGFPFDVIVISRERFEETKAIVGSIAYPAQKYGKVIYEAA